VEAPADQAPIQLEALSPVGEHFFWHNVELVRPLPASGEDELGVKVQTTTDAANTAAGSGLHEATC
jgi:hypothetical protein